MPNIVQRTSSLREKQIFDDEKQKYAHKIPKKFTRNKNVILNKFIENN